MISKSPRLHQNYMKAYRERNDILNHHLDAKSSLSQELENDYRRLLDNPIFKLAAELEQLLLQVRTLENMDELKFGEYAGYKFARTAFPRLDVKGQHMRVYVDGTSSEEDIQIAKGLLRMEMKKILDRNKAVLRSNPLYSTLVKNVKNEIEQTVDYDL